MITATPDGRYLRIQVLGAEGSAADSEVDDFVVAPLSAKRGYILSRMYVAQTLATIPALGVDQEEGALESVMIEAIGVANYERLAGAIVVPVPADDPAFAAGLRYRQYERHEDRVASDGEPLRAEEVQQILQAAFYWQSVVGLDGVKAFLEDPGFARGKAIALLYAALGIRLSPTSHSGASESQTPEDATPATSTPTGTSSSVVLPPVRSVTGAAGTPKVPTDRLPRKSRTRLHSGRA
jgi:hypothetical protein